jgi:hypothetical protein
MKIVTMLDNIIGYLSDATARIFALDRATYPTIGFQPYEGDIYEQTDQNW